MRTRRDRGSSDAVGEGEPEFMREPCSGNAVRVAAARYGNQVTEPVCVALYVSVAAHPPSTIGSR
jgi:hypothetical protein